MRTKTAVLASLIVVAMFAAMFQPVAHVAAAVPEPFELHGIARQETSVVLQNGEPIRTFVDGVDFSNKTSVFSRPAQNDGYFDVDTFGNHYTNLTSPNTPWIKEGSDENESIMYVWGEMSNDTQLDVTKPWLTGIIFEETHLWQTGLPPVAGDLTAAPATLQPPLIKIQTIVVDSADPPANPTDYVWLCNPTPNIVDASQFYIQKDVIGNVNGPKVTIPSGEVIQPYGKYYLDTGDVNWFIPTGDNVKLVWNNTPGPNAPFGGNDIIVDRVEFNASTGGTLFWEPGNTNQNDEIAPGNGFQINRSASCRDTNSRVQDFFLTSEGLRQNKKPLAPWPMSIAGIVSQPVNYSNIYHLIPTSNIVLTWTHNDPDVPPHAQQGADVRITTQPNQGGTTVFINFPSGTTNTTTILPPVILSKCFDYYYSAKTRDSEWSDYYAEWMFHTNCLPTGLNLQTPPNFGVVTSPVTLTWLAATDNDPGDSINYTWEIATDPGFIIGSIVANGTTQTPQSPPQTLADGTYYWHVKADDGWESVPFTAAWQFIVAPSDVAPTVDNVAVAGYTQGATELTHIVARPPTFSWVFDDGNGDAQGRYNITLSYASNSTLVWWQNQTGTAQSVISPSLINGMSYFIQVVVQDDSGAALWSQWSPQLNFRMNTPPPEPTLSTPADGATPSPGDITLTWTSVTDAEGDTVTYEYCVDTTSPPACGVHQGTTDQLSAPAFTAADATTYYWRVRANDAFENSTWSSIWSFTPTSIPPNTAPTIDITSQPGDLTGQGTFTITWTMHDNETAQAQLVVVLEYRIGTQSPVLMASLTGQTSYAWRVADIDATNVVIIATVTDEGGLTGTDQTLPFNIVKKVEADLTMWIILIVIIIVVVILILVLLMRRKKPEEAEAEAPPPEGEVAEFEEEEAFEEEAAPAAAAAAAPAAKAPGKTRECPSCGTIVSATDKECFMCGSKL